MKFVIVMLTIASNLMMHNFAGLCPIKGLIHPGYGSILLKLNNSAMISAYVGQLGIIVIEAIDKKMLLPCNQLILIGVESQIFQVQYMGLLHLVASYFAVFDVAVVECFLVKTAEIWVLYYRLYLRHLR